MEKIRLGISSCLLGQRVRYDGGHKRERCLTDILGRCVEWVGVCPEVESGLRVPREEMRLAESPAGPRLITAYSGVDHTDLVREWAGKKFIDLAAAGICGFVFKAGSPSCGVRGLKISTASGFPVRPGSGIFAAAFMEKFPSLPVEEEGRLRDPSLRMSFLMKVLAFVRRRDSTRKRVNAGLFCIPQQICAKLPKYLHPEAIWKTKD
jgi:uncharacterized protein YbbK (DUF523 family)